MNKIKPGFTLIELMFALAVGVVVLSIVISVSITMQKVWAEQFNNNNITARFIEISERLMAQADKVNQPNQLNLQNIPYGNELLITNIGGQVVKVVLDKTIGSENYHYEQYFKLGL